MFLKSSSPSVFTRTFLKIILGFKKKKQKQTTTSFFPLQKDQYYNNCINETLMVNANTKPFKVIFVPLDCIGLLNSLLVCNIFAFTSLSSVTVT